MQILKLRFKRVGVNFNIITNEESTAMTHACWANIG